MERSKRFLQPMASRSFDVAPLLAGFGLASESPEDYSRWPVLQQSQSRDIFCSCSHVTRLIDHLGPTGAVPRDAREDTWQKL